MINFTKLRIQGFKSFVEATDLPIEAGLTGIVGPNGCGKSNLVEALRWAMGETSAKRLRGGEMADVIFAGTEKRPARNLAEVVISLDNQQRSVTSAFNHYDDLVVSRKIDRDRGSTYRVNGQEVRARDVQLLFTDSASGASSTSLVGQGKINAIITAKPAERRMLLEEAAGIGGLRTRRHEANLRLKSAETNLGRLDEVLSDLGARRRELMRQSRQAEKYRSLSEEIRRLDLQIAALDWLGQQQAVQQTASALTQSQQQAAESQAALARQTAAFEELEAMIAPRRAQEQAAAAALQHLRIKRDQTRADLARAQAQCESARTNQKQLGDDLARETAILEQAGKTRVSLDEEEQGLTAQKAAAEQALARHEGEARALAEALRQADEALQAKRQSQAALTSQAAGLEVQLQRARRDLETRQAQARQMADKRQAIEDALASDEGLQAAKQQAEARREELSQVAARLTDVEERLEAEQANEQTARDEAHSAKQALASLENEIASLQRLLGLDAQGRPFANKNGQNGQLSSQAVSRNLRAPAELAAAVAAVLGAEAALGAAQDAGAGGWRCLESLEGLHAPAGSTALLTAIEAPQELTRRFQGVGLVDSLEQAQILQAELSAGQMLVTRDGWLVSWDGLVADPNAADSGLAERLRQQERLTQLEPQLPAVRSTWEQAQQASREAEAQRQESAQSLRELRSKRQALQTALSQAEQALARLQQAQEGQQRQLTSLEAQAQQVGEEIARAQALLQELEDKVHALPDTSALAQDISAGSAGLQDLRRRLGQERAACESSKQAQLRAQERLAAIGRERTIWRERAEAAELQQGSFDQRCQALTDEIARLEASQGALTEALTQQNGQEQTLAAQHQLAAKTLQDVDAELDSFKRALKQAEQAAQTAQGDLIRAETLAEGAREQRQALQSRLSEAHGMTPDGILAKCELDVNDAEGLPQRDALAQRLETAKGQRAGLGAVNLRAAQEAEELQTNAQDYEQEKAELEEAIAKLRRTISTLNKEARQRVLEAYEAINTRFKDLFTELFGGGRASLELIESDDPLEAGLEVFAQPPGKKLQSMSLLSGGEQTMSAISLLFAVFLVNPAPICVLDEVDAPLDEANVERFCKIVRRLAETTGTRFLVVTHHPVSMARMDRLFGVTMQERGVSTLVSLDLNQAERLVA